MKQFFTPTRVISLGFLVLIIIGSAILCLPVASAAGEKASYIDILFTSASSVCVTGLLTLPNYSQWSVFGQIVVLILIEIGGLGIVTFNTIFLLLLGRRIGLKERLLIQDAYNLNSMQGLVRMVTRILKGTLLVEAIGALLYMFVFVPEFGIKGIWISIFNSISAFCNAGMDIISDNSLINYYDNVLVNFVTIILILLGGIGFPVWWYFVDGIKARIDAKKNLGEKIFFRHMPLLVKIPLFMTGILVVSGFLVTFLIEFSNPETIGNMSIGNKLMASLFQSVTWRTAGFATVPQEGLRNSTVVFGSVLMFIGGCPSGTAGGIKTSTILIILATAVSIVREHNDTQLFRRKINENMVRRALAIFLFSFSILIIALFFMCIFEKGDFVDVFYETVSALGTVGLSRGYTGKLSMGGKIIIIIAMYLGRIGPISLSMFFNTRSYINKISYAEEKVSVG